MKFLEIIVKYKYVLIALALVSVIAAASVLYNSLSDEYRGDGFAELPNSGADSGSQGSGDGDKPSNELNSDENGGENSTTEIGDNSGSEDDHDHSGDDDHDHGGDTESQAPTVFTYDFTAIDKGGNTVKLSDFVGKPIVLNFWATWCPYCLEEMPEFNKAAKELPDVTFLMLNATTTEGETLAKAKNYILQNGFEFPVLYDTMGKAVSTFGINSFPMTFFIDESGVIRLYASGAVDYDIILSALERMNGDK